MTPTADIVIRNAHILTMNDAAPRSAALAIAGDRILALGEAAEAMASSAGRVIDAQGGTVLPGFNEAHLHIFLGAVSLRQMPLIGVHGFEALRTTVLACAAATPGERLITANWADYGILGDGRAMTRHVLDRILPDRPLLLMAPDNHTAWANTAALRAAGILEGRSLSVGNEIVMGEDGLATGELREGEAYGPVTAMGEAGGRHGLGMLTGGEPQGVGAQDREGDMTILREGLAYCAANGITSITNMDGNLYQLEMLAEIEAAEGLPVRVRSPFHLKNFMPLSDIEAKAAAWRARFDSDKLRCDFVKIFADGVVESGTAFMAGDYADEPGRTGEPLFPPEHLNAAITEADRLGLQVAVHAIGDGAVSMVLDAHEAARTANGPRDARHRVEHIEAILPGDIARLARLGAVASMQPTHAPGAGYPLEPYASRLGAERWPTAFPWRALAEAGAPIVFSTDWPVMPLDPLASLKAAVTRTPFAPGVPDHRIGLHASLAAATRAGGWVDFMEDRKGVLKPGYLADVVVLDGDVEAVAPEDISSIAAAITICNGVVTFEG